MAKRSTANPFAIAACVFTLGAAASNELQLLPAGQFQSADGRPFDAAAWQLTPDIAARVIARAAAHANAFVIDYEHQSLHTEFNGRPAPAAGWFTTLEFRDGSGLWATDVQWTERAKQMIAGGEYRYISAVFTYMPDSGEVLRILNAGVTNTPALDGLAELELAAAAKLNSTTNHQDDPTDEEPQVTPELLQLLGLNAEASEESAFEAVTALKAAADTADEQIAALKAATPDPAQYVPIAGVNSMKEELTALRKQVNDTAIDTLVKPALEDGRLLPAQEDWARSLGASDIAALKSYLDTAQPIAALKATQTGGKPPEGGDGARLDDEQRAMCRRLGLDEADYLKALPQE